MADEASKAILSQVRSGKSVPGMTLATVVPNYIQVEFGDKINAIEDADEKAKYQADLNKYYMTGDGKDILQPIMDAAGYYYGLAESLLKPVATNAAQLALLASNLNPAVIVAGSATGVPNPAWVNPFGTINKGYLTAQLTMGKDALGNLIDKAILLHFNITPVATALLAFATAGEAAIAAVPSLPDLPDE